MIINWESLALGLLSLCTCIAGYWLKQLVGQIAQLAKCVTIQSEKWKAHEARHAELREDRKSAEDEIRSAIKELRAAHE